MVAASLEDLPRAIAAVHQQGPALRERTVGWYRDNAKALSAADSARRIEAEYQTLNQVPGT